MVDFIWDGSGSAASCVLGAQSHCLGCFLGVSRIFWV